MTNEDLTTDDLVELKSSRIVRPRPPTLTSIPSLLSVFQNEWDALALETYNLRQHLTQTRQELSRALYEHDAAVRVITRLSIERDEAREALSKITVNGGPVGNGDAMQIDGQGLSGDLVAKVEATQEKYATIIQLRISNQVSEQRLIVSSDYPRLDESVPFQITGPLPMLSKASSQHRNLKRFMLVPLQSL